ncbi:MAG TPA: endonuclease/exonuclease/phosphatase family protein [Pseudonocardiaceae bacterium]|jgi:hypothetical protein|nr:endonuclease/exonuclease/phosphatase family protein [Pseudonocardiaceae bacterium]
MSSRAGGRVLLLVVVVLCLAPIQGAATQQPTAGGTCRSIVSAGCVEAEVIDTGGHDAPDPALAVLQFNLCDSGQADCYAQGRSPGEAAGVIERYRPDVVTLNEICSRDVLAAEAPITAELTRLAHEDGDPTAFALFTPAIDEVTGRPYHCVNGDLYGIGIVGRGPALAGPPTRYVYRSQYIRSGEGRVALCVRFGGADVCTTHLESDSGAVASRECGELLAANGYLDRFQGTAHRPAVVAGDLNLGASMGGCAPGWRGRGDRGVQHVLWRGALRLSETRIIPMRDTDHPALLAGLALTG